MSEPDALIIGAGPNGLVAANVLADAGWDVLVLEAEPDIGGAVRHDVHLEPGFISDRFSAFYPLSIVSPHIERLELQRHGLEWRRAPIVLGHPRPDGPSALLHPDLDRTAEGLGSDGAAWKVLMQEWARAEDDLVTAMLAPFPPIRPLLALLADRGIHGSLELARHSLLPVRRLAEERFDGPGPGLLLAGSALHSDVTPDTTLSGFLGWLLTGIAQRHGWPVPRGGAGALTGAMAARLESLGGRIECGARVERIEVRRGRAVGVRLADRRSLGARRAVLADVVAPKLFLDLVGEEHLPDTVLADLRRYQPGSATFKVNWTMNGAIPWTDRELERAGTVHVVDSLDELTIASAQLACGRLPERPFVLLGQMNVADPDRSPAGTSTLWAYSDVPQRVLGDSAGEIEALEGDGAERFADRLERRIEEHAPGFRSLIRRRSIQTPAALERDDANLIGGDKNLGSAQLHQQLVFRPRPGNGRPSTPIKGLFLASASAHPGGAVHGACGANAARSALLADRLHRVTGPIRRLRSA